MKVEFDIQRSPVLAGVAHGFFGSGGTLAGAKGAKAHQFGFGGPGAEADTRSLRAAAADAIAPGAVPVTPHQVHSADVLVVDAPWDDAAQGRPVADALVTARAGLAIGVVTADCGPILLADREAGVIGAAHAGWRGAHDGVLESTLAAMESLGAQRPRIAAALGPTIAQASYEVDAPFRARFEPQDETHFACAPEREGQRRWLFDLPGYIAEKLRQSDVTKFHDIEWDTFANPARYHSYRRATRGGGSDYGRQIALIAL